MIVLLFFSGLVFLLAGTIPLFLSTRKEKSVITFEEGAGVKVGKMKVDVEGAVVRPGVYDLGIEGRVQEALILAGGLSSQADREWVSKNLNLAAKLVDGAKIYIPKIGETGLSSSGGGSLGEKVNINSASSADLDKLPGIGPVTAQKIIEGRPYQSIEDLLGKKIVSSSTFSEIKEKITAW